MLLIVVLLLVLQTSRTEKTSSKNSDPPVFILQDVSDGKCLSGSSFKRCALDTLWFVSGKPGSYQINRKHISDSHDHESYCLSKEVCDQDNSTLGVFPCDHCSKHKWNVLGEAQTGMSFYSSADWCFKLRHTGYVLTEDNINCLKRENSSVMMTKCDQGYSSLSLQCKLTPLIVALRS